MFTNITNKIYNKWSEKGSDIACSLLFALIFLIIQCGNRLLNGEIFSIEYDETTKGFIVIALLLLIILFSILGKKVETPIFNKPLTIGWLLFGLITTFWTLTVKTGSGYLPFCFALLIVFPLLTAIWVGRRDFESLFIDISIGIEIAFAVVTIITFLLYPISWDTTPGGLYSGINGNTNVFGLFYGYTITGALFLFYVNQGNRYFHSIVVAISSAFIFYSGSRCALLAVVLEIVVFLAFYIKYEILLKDRERVFSGKILPLLVSIILIFAAIATVDNIFRLDLLNVTDSEHEVELSSVLGKITDKDTSYEALKEQEEQLQTDILKDDDTEIKEDTIEKSTEDITSTEALSNASVSKLTSGRTDIWIAYLNNISMRGHGIKEREKIWSENVLSETRTHNDYIEYAYALGFPAVFLYLMLTLYGCVAVVQYFFKTRKFKPYMIFTALVVVGYIVYSMIEIVLSPVSSSFGLMYYIGLIPLFKGIKKKVGSEQI